MAIGRACRAGDLRRGILAVNVSCCMAISADARGVDTVRFAVVASSRQGDVPRAVVSLIAGYLYWMQ
jgi:hypothetical protein